MNRFPLLATATVAGAIWIALAALRWGTALDRHLVEVSLGLAAATAVPLALAAVIEIGRAARLAAVAWIGAGFVAGALLSPRGATAAILAAAWLVPTTLAAFGGLARLARRGPRPIEELAADVAMLYLPAAAVWLIADRAGFALLGTAAPLVALTAIHFLYAGFATAVIAAAVGRTLRRVPAKPIAFAAYRAAATAALVAVPLVAAGIHGWPLLELAAAALLAFAIVGLAAVALLAVAPRLPSPAARGLLAMAATTVLFTMSCALLYAAGEYSGAPILSLGDMLELHGIINVVGFALPALAAFAIAAPAPTHDGSRAPLSRLYGEGHIGPELFERTGAAMGAHLPSPGLIDSIEELAGPELDPGAVDPAIVRFYERTAEHALHVVPRWHPVARPVAALFRRYARRVGQLGLPLDPVADGEMTSRLLWLREDIDGRPWPRAWVRTYAGGETAYAAAYSMHQQDDVAYMNIAFPLPGGNLTSVLRLAGDGGGGLCITTLAAPGRFGDEGIFWVSRRGRPLRLPMNETIWVAPRRQASALSIGTAPAAAEGATVVARHDVWILGLRVLTLEYFVSEKRSSA
jgi:hypothetical protein